MRAVIRWAQLGRAGVIEAIRDFVVLGTAQYLAHRGDVLGANRYIL